MELKWLPKDGKVRTGFQDSLAISRRQQDRQRRSQLLDRACKAEPVHLSGHHDVAEYNIDPVPLDFLKRGMSIGNPSNGISELFEQAGAGEGYVRIVLDKQHRATSKLTLDVMLGGFGFRLAHSGKANGKCRPLTQLAVHGDGA